MMPRKPKLIQLLLVGTTLLGVFIGVYLVAWKRSSKPDPSGVVVGHPVETQPDDVLKYWTADKMRHAKPATMPHVTAPDQGTKHSRRPRHTSDPEHS